MMDDHLTALHLAANGDSPEIIRLLILNVGVLYMAAKVNLASVQNEALYRILVKYIYTYC